MHRVKNDLRYGITPAWAGKREPGVLMVWQFQDHPRVGGEKQIGGDNGLDKQGSPPRGRGKGATDESRSNGFGITPAWAGKSHRD